MIIAMVSEEESWDNHMSEGRQVAEKCDAVFVSTSDPEWTSELQNYLIYVKIWWVLGLKIFWRFGGFY